MSEPRVQGGRSCSKCKKKAEKRSNGKDNLKKYYGAILCPTCYPGGN